MQNKDIRKKITILFFFIIIVVAIFFSIKETTFLNHLNSSFLKNPIDNNDIKIPKRSITFLIFKKEKQLELWLNSDTGTILIKHYDIIINNNQLGPKISNGTSLFPEGVYSVTGIDRKNLIINFPNKFDRNKAIADNRVLKKESILFGKLLNNSGFSLEKTTLTTIYQLIETENIHDIQLISAPIDFRKNVFLPYCNHCPHWINELYSQLELILNDYRL